jgi:streptomycin 6-kinase
MTSQMEREANIFGAALRIDDKELLDLIFSYGYIDIPNKACQK